MKLHLAGLLNCALTVCIPSWNGFLDELKHGTCNMSHSLPRVPSGD